MAPKLVRNKQARLEEILAKQDAFERRTLADLNALGYRFTTIAQARARRAAIRKIAALSADELEETIVGRSRGAA